jgi:plasmid stabilization system protein ParE
MTKKAELQWMPRVLGDIERCRRFLRRQPSRRPLDRIREVANGIRAVQENPELNRVRIRHPTTLLEMRRHNVDQFVIIYAYFRPCESLPRGMVSIRAIRHAREEDVFWGVNDPAAAPDAGRFGQAALTLRDEG